MCTVEHMDAERRTLRRLRAFEQRMTLDAVIDDPQMLQRLDGELERLRERTIVCNELHLQMMRRLARRLSELERPRPVAQHSFR